ncbi:MAG: APC family permease [Gammaproteobacteria bacterium]|nr:APC family permease [Gammaproteobacteria bacterium]
MSIGFQRSIGPVGLLFTGIGSVIGSGWLFGPLYAAQIAGPAAIISWIIGGLLMIIIALTFAELGSAFPVAGGMVQYAEYSHGSLISFMTGWMIWISSIAVAPVETMGLLQYAGNYIPGLVTKVQNVTVLTTTGIFAGAALMLLMCFLNYQGARFFSRSNACITAIKLIIPISTFLILLIMDFHTSNFTSPTSGGFMPMGWHGVLAALPLGGILYSFIGSNTVLQLAGETKRPQFSIPMALIGSVVFCIILYVLLQVALIGALAPADLFNGWKNVHYTGDNGPFAGILMSFGLSWFVLLVYADAFISPFGTAFIYTASTSRISYGLSKIGFLPEFFQKLSKKHVPTRAIILNYFAGLFLFLPFPGWQSMVGFIISCFIISYIIGPIALVGLRKTRPDAHRPFRLPCVHLVGFVAFYACNLLIFWTGWQTIYRMMIAMVIGFVCFAVHAFRSKGHMWNEQFRRAWWIFPYLIGMCITSYLGTFGGGRGLISFGIDFAVVGLLSLVIFSLAVYSLKFATVTESRVL